MAAADDRLIAVVSVDVKSKSASKDPPVD